MLQASCWLDDPDKPIAPVVPCDVARLLHLRGGHVPALHHAHALIHLPNSVLDRFFRLFDRWGTCSHLLNFDIWDLTPADVCPRSMSERINKAVECRQYDFCKKVLDGHHCTFSSCFQTSSAASYMRLRPTSRSSRFRMRSTSSRVTINCWPFVLCMVIFPFSDK